MKKSIAIVAISLAVLSGSAIAGGGGGGSVDIRGWLKAEGSGGSRGEIKNSTVTVAGNRSQAVTLGGGALGAYGVDAKMESVANVNSVVLDGGTIESSKVNVINNSSGTVNGFGGEANVNSVILK